MSLFELLLKFEESILQYIATIEITVPCTSQNDSLENSCAASQAGLILGFLLKNYSAWFFNRASESANAGFWKF